MITQEHLKQFLNYDPDTGIFTWKTKPSRQIVAGSIAGSLKKHKNYSRIIICIEKKEYKAHRLAWLYVYGCFPINDIDHINGNSIDNRINNLRDVTHAINKQNIRKPQSNNKTRFLGVSTYKTKFRAMIKVFGKQKYLGSFDTP